MVNTKKFSEFVQADITDDTTQTVGLTAGVNTRELKFVSWTTATRPTIPYDGLLGYNFDLSQYEFWDAAAVMWVPIGGGGAVLAVLASHLPGEGASLIGLQGAGTVQDFANSTLILKTANANLPNSFALASLSTGILKSTTVTGALSISAPLTSIDGLTTSADQMIYTTGSNVYATTPLTAVARTMLSQTTNALILSTIGALPSDGSGMMTGILNMNSHRIINVTDPVNPQDAATKNYVDAGAFLRLDGTSVMAGVINVGSHKIINLTDPTSPQDGATKAYVDTAGGAFLPLAGGTMSGDIVMGNHKITSLGNPTNPQDAVTLFYLSAQLTNYLPLAGGTMALNTGVINMNSSKIIGLADPTNSQDAATKAYVDLVATGLTVQGACYASTTGDLTGYTYLNGALGIGATLTAGSNGAFSTDGTSPPLNARIFVPFQTSTLQNGIYTLSQIGTVGTPAILTRATDYDQPSEIQPGDFIIVNNGTLYGTTSWIETSTVTAVGTDPILFSQFTFAPTSFLLKAQNLADVASKTTSFNNISPLTTKGDLIGFSTQNVRLAVGGTDGQILQVSSAAATGLAWSTATYPATTTINQILFSSAANTVTGISSTAGGVLVTNASSVPQFLANPSASGKLLASVSGAIPIWTTPTYPTVSGSAGLFLISDGTNNIYSTSTIPTSAGATAGKVLISDGTNYVLSTPTFPNASAAAGKFIRSDGTNWIASTPTLPISAGTSGKILQSNGTNYVESTPTYPSASGTARKLLVSDGTNIVYTTETWAVPGTSGNVLTSDGTNWISAAAAGVTLLTTKGDLFGFSTVNARVPVATGNGKVLQVDSTATVGVSYSTPTYPSASGASGLFLISDGTNNVYSTSSIPSSAGATANKVLLSNGTNYVLSTPTFPNASATARKIIVSDGTNWIASTETYAVPGSSGNVMTSDGTNWTSAAPAAASGWVKISSTTASASASVTFSSLTTTYQAYCVVLTNVIPTTNNVNLLLTFNSIASNYFYTLLRSGTGGAAATNDGSASTSSIPVNAGATIVNTANGGLSGFIMMPGPDTANNQFVDIHVGFLSSVYTASNGIAGNSGTTAITSIKFAMSSGTIASGVFTLYGLVA